MRFYKQDNKAYYNISYVCQYGYERAINVNQNGYLVSGAYNPTPWNKKHHIWHLCNPLYNPDTDRFISNYDRFIENSPSNAPRGKAGEIINKNTLTEQLVRFLLMDTNDMINNIGCFQPLEYKRRIIQFIDTLFD